MKKGIYLAACIARHPKHNIVYQDIEKEKYNCDIGGDMLETRLERIENDNFKLKKIDYQKLF